MPSKAPWFTSIGVDRGYLNIKSSLLKSNAPNPWKLFKVMCIVRSGLSQEPSL